MRRLLDYATLAKMEAAAPHVMDVPVEQAVRALVGLRNHILAHEAMHDDAGRIYWQCSLKELYALVHKNAEPETGDLRRLGTAVRAMGLTVWRMNDGWHLAWSEGQLEILTAKLIVKPILQKA